MASIGNGKATRIGANGEGAGNKTLGTIKGRKLGYPGEGKPYMQALTNKPQHCPVHKQEVCAVGRGMGNKGNGWKINGNEAKVSGPAIATFMKPVNHKDPQRAKKR